MPEYNGLIKIRSQRVLIFLFVHNTGRKFLRDSKRFSHLWNWIFYAQSVTK